MAEEQVDRLAAFRVLTQGFRPLGLLAQQQLGLVGIEIGRGDLLGQGHLEQLFCAVIGQALGLQVGPEATDAHHAGQPLQHHGAGGAGVDIALAPGHLVL